MKRNAIGCLVCAVSLSSYGLILIGCRSPAHYREKADEVAYDIIEQKQQEALGKVESFNVERPSDTLRRRLLEAQGLAYSSEASFGTDVLPAIPHWPEPNRPYDLHSPDGEIAIDPNEPLKISLIDALQIAARNSPSYQSQKESVFQAALSLDLRRDAFRTIVTAQADATVSRNPITDTTTVDAGGGVGVGRTLKNGLDISAAITLGLISLFPGSDTVNWGVDPSISLPLLRGAGRHIVTEPLTQAERDVIYAMWNFERFKHTFAVNVADRYFAVLESVDSMANAQANYESAVQSARWSRRRGDAGRLNEIEVDQAVQRELSARNQWISTQERLKSQLDSFKIVLGLPVDARIELDQTDLIVLREQADKIIEDLKATARDVETETAPPADAPVELVQPSREGAGPLEMDERPAIELAFENRLDLRVLQGDVYDAQRQVVVAADNLRARLGLNARASFAGDNSDGGSDLRATRYSGTMTLDLPIDERSRTAERNAYRNSLIGLERATRSVQSREDEIKLAIRNQLRNLRESRESLQIQAQSVVLAEKRVRSTGMFLEAGRRQIRDLLDAQQSLLDARNALTAAVVNYRIAELQIQSDLGILEVNERGLWEEFSPEDINHDSQQQQS